DIHRLVSAFAVDRPQPLLELRNSGRQFIDGDVAISRVLEHDLAWWRLVWALAPGRDVAVNRLLCQRQRRPEDDQQDEQDIEQRREIHLHAQARSLASDDLVWAEMAIGVWHRRLLV